MAISDESTRGNGGNNRRDQISERLPSFPLLLQQFHLTCDSIRELAGQLKPHVANLDQDMLDKDLGKIVKQVGVGPKVMLRVVRMLRHITLIQLSDEMTAEVIAEARRSTDESDAIVENLIKYLQSLRKTDGHDKFALT